MENFKENYAYANSLYDVGKVDKALNIYVELFKANPNRVDILKKILWIYFDKSDFRNASEYIDLYLDKYPHDLEVLSAKVCVLFSDSQFHEALTVCNRMIEIDADSVIAYSFKLSLLEVLERNNEREEILKFLKKSKPEVYDKLNLFRDKNEDSVDDLCNALQNQKSQLRFKRFFEDLYNKLTNDIDNLALYDFIIDEKHNNKEFNALYKKAQEYFLKEDYSKALDYIKWGLEFYPNNIDALIFKSIVQLKTYKYYQVLDTVDTVLNLDKKNILAYVIKGLVNIDLEKYDEAESSFKTALSLDLNNVNLWREYYMALTLNNNPKVGFELNNEAISKFPKNKELYKDKMHFINVYGYDDKKQLHESDDVYEKSFKNTVNSTLDDFY